jgi:bisphosphoglycerate-dependent phosphoglycerate mutase
MWRENTFLIRHAKSSWDDTALPDKDRPLDDRGKRDAPKRGKRLAKRDVQPDLILSSPAMRALTTAKIIAKKLDYTLEDIGVDDRLHQQHRSRNPTLVVLGVSKNSFLLRCRRPRVRSRKYIGITATVVVQSSTYRIIATRCVGHAARASAQVWCGLTER